MSMYQTIPVMMFLGFLSMSFAVASVVLANKGADFSMVFLFVVMTAALAAMVVEVAKLERSDEDFHDEV